MRTALLLALSLSAPSARAEERLLGFTFPAWWKDALDWEGSQRSLERLAATGADWVAFVPTWYMDDRQGSSIVRTDSTSTDESLRSAIRRAKGLGLKVLLKPHVDLTSGAPRAFIQSSDPDAWFRSYRELLLPYARMASEEGVEMFCVGTELFGMSGPTQRPRWMSLLREVRAAYGGPLTYAANWYDAGRVSFWSGVDVIGVDAYYPLLGSSVAQLKASWGVYLPGLRALAEGYGKPLVFTEIGVASQSGAALKPWEWREFGPADPWLQERYFRAFLEVFDREAWFGGFLQWAWTTDPEAGGPEDKSMTVQGKPALGVLEAYFRRARGRAVPPAPPADFGRPIGLPDAGLLRFDGRLGGGMSPVLP